MKKIKIFAMIDMGIMVILLFLIYITDYIQRHDTRINVGLSPIGFWNIIFLFIFLIAAAILILLLYIIITVHFINRSMKPLKIIAMIDAVIIIVSVFAISMLNYFYSIRNLPLNYGVSFLFDVFSWSLLMALPILPFIILVSISVFITKKIKYEQKKNKM